MNQGLSKSLHRFGGRESRGQNRSNGRSGGSCSADSGSPQGQTSIGAPEEQLWTLDSSNPLFYKIRKCISTAGTHLERYWESSDSDGFPQGPSFEALKELYGYIEDESNNRQAPLDIFRLLGDVHFERMMRLGWKIDADKAEFPYRFVMRMGVNEIDIAIRLMKILHVRYERTLLSEYVDEALEIGEMTAAGLEDDDEELPELLSVCAVLLLDQSDMNNSPESLQMAIELLRTADHLQEGAWGYRKLYIRQYLAETLHRRFEVCGDPADIFEAVKIFDEEDKMIASLEEISLDHDVNFTPKKFLPPGREDEESKLLPRILVDKFLWPYKLLEYTVLRTRTHYRFWKLNPVLGYLNMKIIQGMDKLDWILRFNSGSPWWHELLQLIGRIREEEQWRFYDPYTSSTGFSLISTGLFRAELMLKGWGPAGTDVPGFSTYLSELALSYKQQGAYYASAEAIRRSADGFMKCYYLTPPKNPRHAWYAALAAQNLLPFKGTIIQPTILSLLIDALTGQPPMYLEAKASIAAVLGAVALVKFEDREEPCHLKHAVNHFHAAMRLSETNSLAKLSRGCDYARCLGRLATTSPGEVEVKELEEVVTHLNFQLHQIRTYLDWRCEINIDEIQNAIAYLQQAQYMLTGDRQFADLAVAAWQFVFRRQHSKPLQRFSAAMDTLVLQQKIMPWIDKSARDPGKDAETLAEAVEAALALMSESDTRQEQLAKIVIVSSLPMKAASAALQAGTRVDEVIQLLERSRTHIWNRILARRLDVEILRQQAPSLADRFNAIRRRLPRAEDHLPMPGDSEYDLARFDPIKLLSQNIYHSTTDYELLLKQIRTQPGFENFPNLDLSAKELKKHAMNGAIVMFVHSQTSHAIIITSTAICAQELPEFCESECERHYDQLQHCLKRYQRFPDEASDMARNVLKWMWTAAAGPLLKTIKMMLPDTSTSTFRDLPRIWWICSGWINVLPIHAAGDYEKTSERPCSVYDMAISSYTPTIQALDYARKTLRGMKIKQSKNPSKALLVGMKYTPDSLDQDLPAVVDELQTIESMLQNTGNHCKIIKMGYPVSTFGKPALRKSVMSALRTCTIAHFACHGVAAEHDPLESRLYLQDWKKHPFTVGYIMANDLETCQLVNISACEVAVNNNAALREEGLHISGGMQMAGIPNTIATWWSVSDVHCVEFSKNFYDGLLSVNGVLNVCHAAASVREAAMALRNQGVSPVVWASYAHFGA
ncbi:hypothetical protein K432DRAFT_387197 [Lepidopterella palustris CBS 459.81]|uniref:CHAT domain-containing protein n=1 Tax=Lepidopterella palustris CBS 459.81 TaxID=1314670 RepID=A0A8E2DY61_9PEZI|nr:hypothetical protein K432DRAFT_387197 [Lepidopterella palustris CBS 459.81]